MLKGNPRAEPASLTRSVALRAECFLRRFAAPDAGVSSRAGVPEAQQRSPLRFPVSSVSSRKPCAHRAGPPGPWLCCSSSAYLDPIRLRRHALPRSRMTRREAHTASETRHRRTVYRSAPVMEARENPSVETRDTGNLSTGRAAAAPRNASRDERHRIWVWANRRMPNLLHARAP